MRVSRTSVFPSTFFCSCPPPQYEKASSSKAKSTFFVKRRADKDKREDETEEMGAPAKVSTGFCGSTTTGDGSDDDGAGAEGKSCACVMRDCSWRPMARFKFTISALEEGDRDMECIMGAKGGSGLMFMCLGARGYDVREVDLDDESLNHLTAFVTATSSMPYAGFSSTFGLSIE